MFDAYVGAALNALVGAFLGALFSEVVGYILPIMKAGKFAKADSAAQIIAYVEVVGGNWLRAALLGALMIPLARAAVEARVSA